MHLCIDADGSPTGFVAWYNHRTDICRIRNLRPMIKKLKLRSTEDGNVGYLFCSPRQSRIFYSSKNTKRRSSKKLNIQIRSDSKSTIEQLSGVCEIKDSILERIYNSINVLCKRIPRSIRFTHVKRNKNIAGIILEEKRQKARNVRIHLKSLLTSQ